MKLGIFQDFTSIREHIRWLNEKLNRRVPIIEQVVGMMVMVLRETLK
jgi:hypothetical protein